MQDFWLRKQFVLEFLVHEVILVTLVRANSPTQTQATFSASDRKTLGKFLLFETLVSLERSSVQFELRVPEGCSIFITLCEHMP